MIVVEDVVEDMVIEHKGGREGGGGRVHVSTIEPIVEHVDHGYPQRKRRTPSCGTH